MKRALLLFGTLLALPYAGAPIYRFPAPTAFAGDRFFNPYEHLSGTWQRANLHAHGRAWLGLTSGRQSSEEVVQRYRELGYSIPGVSNYHDIAAHDGVRTIPLYEHGYNLGKHHQLAIGAHKVDWVDFPIWQSRSHLQYIIDRVAATTELVALVHPESRNAYGADDLQALTGYHLIEVVNGKFPHEQAWDAALSSGHAVWAVGNDDNHDLEDRERLGVAWTMIDATSPSTEHVVAALRAGRSYAVLRTNEAVKDTVLDSVRLSDGTLTVAAKGELSTFDFVGQGGVVKKTVAGALTASYAVQPSDTYIRTIIRAPRITMYLNPVVRYDGSQIPAPRATIDPFRTWLLRAAFAAAALVALLIHRRRRAVAAAMVVLFAATPAFAQTAPELQPLGTTYETDLLDDLPTSDNLFAVLETLQPPLISDRFSNGGLSAGQPARVGGSLSSWTQTMFRVGDVNITEPTGSGAPIVDPNLLFWRRINVATGLLSPDVNATGLSITLEPRMPTTRWSGTARGAISHGGFAGSRSSSAAPRVAELDHWGRLAAMASGPLIEGRLGLVVAASWTGASQFDRGERDSRGRRIASALAHVVFTPTADDEIRTVAWLQGARAPFAYRTPFDAADTTTTDRAAHVQVTWERRVPDTPPWRVYGSYTRQRRAVDFDRTGDATFERLIDGPVWELAWTAPATTRQWSLGARVGPGSATVLRSTHTGQAGIELGGSRVSSTEFFAGSVHELVDGRAARLWLFDDPEIGSRRKNFTIGVYASDTIRLFNRVTADLGLRFDSLSATAGGVDNDIQWRTWMPRARLRWHVTDRWQTAVIAGYGRSAYRLPLDFLAVGDPGAPTADVFRSDSAASPVPGGDPPQVRFGPGTGGNPGLSRIDRDLARPTSSELAIGIEVQPVEGLRLGLTGVARTERDLVALVNVGAAASAYSTVTIADPGADVLSSRDDKLITVFNRRPESFGQDRYLLTNPEQDDATFNGIEITIRYSNDRFLLFGGATAGIALASAANRGFGPLENDHARLGELFINPNAATLARGRLFTDRAYTVKLATVYRFREDLRLGLIARYQDGQPFARVLVVPDLNQGTEAIRAFANGDSRFTYTPTLDVRVTKRFAVRGRRVDAILDAYNVLNLEKEVEEIITSAPGVRTPSAIQPPRAIHLGLRVAF